MEHICLRLGDYPPRIKLNFSGTLDDIFTLAHELGHAYHSYLSQKNQPYATYRYTTFNAEQQLLRLKPY